MTGSLTCFRECGIGSGVGEGVDATVRGDTWLRTCYVHRVEQGVLCSRGIRGYPPTLASTGPPALASILRKQESTKRNRPWDLGPRRLVDAGPK